MNNEPNSNILQVELESGELLKTPPGGDSLSLADTLTAHELPLNTHCGRRPAWQNGDSPV